MLIIVSAGVVVYSFSVSAFSSSSSYFQQQTRLDEERTSERVQIIRVWWDAPNQLNLTVLNHGEIDIAIDAVYINGTAVTSFLDGQGAFTGVGKLVGVKFISPIAITSGSFYEIAAVTERGSRTVVNWKA